MDDKKTKTMLLSQNPGPGVPESAVPVAVGYQLVMSSTRKRTR
jgi:hypothetical protein